MRDLSQREEEIVALCVEGLTNEALANRLGISVGTVNTDWVRIKLNVGGVGKTDTVARIIQERADQALRESNLERQNLRKMVEKKESDLFELRTALALLHLAMDQIQSAVWATDQNLVIQLVANGEFPSTHFGVVWEAGKTVYEIFKSTDEEHPAIDAHRKALVGVESEARLTGEFSNLLLRVTPLRDEANLVIGTIAIVNVVGKD